MSSKLTDENAFNIGKSFGLEGDHKPLDDYQKVTKNLNEHFEKNVADSYAKFKTNSLELKSALNDLSKQTENDVIKLRNKSSELIAYLISLMKNDLKNNQWLDEQVQGIFKKALEHYDQALSELFETDTALKAMVGILEQHLNKHIETSGEHVKNYLTDIKNKQGDLLEMEAGYQFGLALRTALDIGN